MPADQTISAPITFLGCSVASFNATMGFNGSPSTLDVQLVEDNNQNFPAHNAIPSTFVSETSVISSISGGNLHTNGNPGTYKKFQADQFIFGGVVTSWRRNHSSSGRYINVQMSDPRIFLKDIPVITDHYPIISGAPGVDPFSNYQVSTPLRNFANPIAGRWTPDGLIFRGYLHTHIEGLRFTFYSTRYSIVFDSSFVNYVAYNYRTPIQNGTIEDIINRTANDNNLDWYVICDTDESETGSANGIVIRVKGIHRKNQYSAANTGINGFITSSIGINNVTSYEIGRELRTDPSRAIFFGDNKRTLVQQTSPYLSPIYQVTGEGYLCDQPLIDLSNVHSENSSLVSDLPTISIPSIDTNISAGSSGSENIDPPTISRSAGSRTIKGYPANEYILRAALHSKEAWATCVWYAFKEIYSSVEYDLLSDFHSGGFAAPISNETFSLTGMSIIPEKMGIYAPPFDREKASFSDVPSTYSSLYVPTPQTEALKEACYQATLKVAQEYYGRVFVAYLGEDASVRSIQDSGGSFDYYGKKIPTVYEICDAAPDLINQNNDNQVASMTAIHRKTSSGAFRTDKGLYRPYCAFRFDNIKNNFPHAKMDNLDPASYLKVNTGGTSFASDSNCILVRSDVSVEQYKFDPRYAIITLNEPIYLGNFLYYTPGGVLKSEYSYTLYGADAPEPGLVNRTKNFSVVSQKLKPITKKDKSGGTREFLQFIYSDYTVTAISSSSQPEINSSAKTIEAKVFQDMLDHRSKIWQEKIGFAEARLVDTTFMQANIPIKWNFLKYGPFFGTSSSFPTDRPTQIVQDSGLTPWNYGSSSNMQTAGDIMADNSTGSVSTIGYGSATAAGMPQFGFGYTITGASPAIVVANLSEISMTYGINGFTTTYRFKTFFGPTGFLKKSEIDASLANTFRVSEVKRDIIKLDSLVKDYEPESGKRFTYIDRSKSVLSSAITSGADKTTAVDGSYLMAGGVSTTAGKVNVSLMGGGAVKEMFEGSSDTYENSVFSGLGELFAPVAGNYAENVQGTTGALPSIHGIPIGGSSTFVPNANPTEVEIKYSPVLDPEEFDSTISLPEA